jgi:hypothetical protein
LDAESAGDIVMTFDNSGNRDVPEYEAFRAAIEMAERDTKATMLRVARVTDSEPVPAQEGEKTTVGGQ